MEIGKQVTSRHVRRSAVRFVQKSRVARIKPSGRFWADAVYHEKPSVTLERLARLESVMLDEIEEIKKMMNAE